MAAEPAYLDLTWLAEPPEADLMNATEPVAGPMPMLVREHEHEDEHAPNGQTALFVDNRVEPTNPYRFGFSYPKLLGI